MARRWEETSPLDFQLILSVLSVWQSLENVFRSFRCLHFDLSLLHLVLTDVHLLTLTKTQISSILSLAVAFDTTAMEFLEPM